MGPGCAITLHHFMPRVNKKFTHMANFFQLAINRSRPKFSTKKAVYIFWPLLREKRASERKETSP